MNTNISHQVIPTPNDLNYAICLHYIYSWSRLWKLAVLGKLLKLHL